MSQLNPQFVSMIEGYAAPQLEGLLRTLESTSPAVAVRVNRHKPSTIAGDSAVPWEPRGLYLDSRPSFTLDPEMHQGRYYVQDASSMVIGEVIRQLTRDVDSPLLYLDACAAPGGKTTAAIDALPAGSMVLANEYDPRRASILAENLAKWGAPRVVVSSGDTSRLRRMNGQFDIVAADVPCSGEGMMRKDSTAVQQWTPALVVQCAARQREILDNVLEALAPGGYLIYSTCTFNRDENEEIVQWLVDERDMQSVRCDFPDHWGIEPGIATPHACYRFVPGRVRGEGLFMAILRKPGSHSAHRNSRGDRPGGAQRKVTIPTLLKHQDRYEIIADGDEIHAVDKDWSAAVAQCRKHLKVVDYGIKLATVKGRDLIPAQHLALSTELNPDAYPRVEVDRAAALSYLRREAIVLDDAPRGIVLLVYNGCPLGWVKNLGNRANNLYPQPWRILH